MAVFLDCTSTCRVGLCFLWFFVQELLEAQPTVVLVLKRLRRRGKWLRVSSDRLGELGFFFIVDKVLWRIPTPGTDMNQSQSRFSPQSSA